jgi:hypothetical protein
MSKPVRLHKVDDAQPFYNSLEAWLQSHAILLLTIAVIILFVLVMLLIVVVFNMISGDHILSMTESNGYYYHLGDI